VKFTDALDACGKRFLGNEVQDGEYGLMKQVELAHWFYLDVMTAKHQTLPVLGELSFAQKLLLRSRKIGLQETKAMFQSYRRRKGKLPVSGAVLLEPSLCEVVMVRGKLGKSAVPWGFPKGKIEGTEDARACAVREVLEETGMDVKDLLVDAPMVQRRTNGKTFSLFLAVLPCRCDHFKPLVQGEIGDVAWMKVAALAPGVQDSVVSQSMAAPFFRSIQEFLAGANTRKGCGTLWCLHEGCLESTEVFATKMELEKHQSQTHARACKYRARKRRSVAYSMRR